VGFPEHDDDDDDDDATPPLTQTSGSCVNAKIAFVWCEPY
jgi:hypothetical protein